MHGAHMIRSWSRMQNLVALSSAEAELYGTVRASAELLGCRSMAKDLGHHLGARVYADASAALGIIHRQGLGKLRHIDTSALWLQQAARQKLIAFTKVAGEHNPADIATKHLAAEPRWRHAEACGMEFLEGRAAIAPKVSADQLAAVDLVDAPEFETQYPRFEARHWGCPRQSWEDMTEYDGSRQCEIKNFAVGWE